MQLSLKTQKYLFKRDALASMKYLETTETNAVMQARSSQNTDTSLGERKLGLK